MPATTKTLLCALCDLEVKSSPVMEEELAFCCHGCHTVYQILKRTGELSGAKESALFQRAVDAGLISNPELLEQLRHREKPDELQRVTVEIGEMWCPSCAEIIRLYLLQQEGVHDVVVDYATDLASISFDPLRCGKQGIFKKIETLGYTVQPLGSPGAKRVNRRLLLRFGVASFCLLNEMMFAYPLYAGDRSIEETHWFAWLSLLVSLPVVTFCLAPIMRRFWSAVTVGLFGMETLVMLGVGSAFGLSLYNLANGSIHVYFDSLTAIVTLVLLGKIIETRAKFSARESLDRLSRALPRRGRRASDGEWLPIKEIAVGELLRCDAGERIVLDGEVEQGKGTCDEALLTGEAEPQLKEKEAPLVAGSLLLDGSVTYRVKRAAEESTLSQIVQQVEQGLQHKPSYIRAVDPVVRWFVPFVVLIAATVWGVTGDSLRAISILLISCPCAIGIAAPLAESLTMNAMARNGAIVRNRGALQLLGDETLVVFDKTGTLTKGRFELHSPLPQETAILKALVLGQTHPLANALDRAIENSPGSLEAFRLHIGKGSEGWFGGEYYRLGSSDFLRASGVKGTFDEPAGFSSLFFSKGAQLLSRIDLTDQLREEAPEVAASLPAVAILSGDSEGAVRIVAEQIGARDYFWRHNPLEKQERLRQWRNRGERLVMLGDGVNDAPALAEAHVGISVLRASDLSAEASDILLTHDDLRVLPKLREIGKKGRRIVKQNLFWAFVYNGVGLGLAVAGKLLPLFAAVAMVLSSIAVVANASRLKRV